MGPNRMYPCFMHPYFPAHLNTHTYKRMYTLSMHAVHTRTHTHVHTYTHVHTRTHMYTHTHTCTHVHTCTYTHTRTTDKRWRSAVLPAALLPPGGHRRRSRSRTRDRETAARGRCRRRFLGEDAALLSSVRSGAAARSQAVEKLCGGVWNKEAALTDTAECDFGLLLRVYISFLPVIVKKTRPRLRETGGSRTRSCGSSAATESTARAAAICACPAGLAMSQ